MACPPVLVQHRFLLQVVHVVLVLIPLLLQLVLQPRELLRELLFLQPELLQGCQLPTWASCASKASFSSSRASCMLWSCLLRSVISSTRWLSARLRKATISFLLLANCSNSWRNSFSWMASSSHFRWYLRRGRAEVQGLGKPGLCALGRPSGPSHRGAFEAPHGGNPQPAFVLSAYMFITSLPVSPMRAFVMFTAVSPTPRTVPST